VSAAVAGGAALLDCADPGWWAGGHRDSIDLAVLSLGSDCLCVLGQRHGTYSAGKKFLGISQDAAERLGFDIPWPMTRPSYGELTAEWRKVIEDRRERAA
jgi:hypothetical protein